MSQITAVELAEILPTLNEKEIVVDVREAEEYEEMHVPGSVNVPLSTIGKNIDQLKQYSKIYLICETGGRSGYAHEVLKTAEITTTDIAGGMFALRDAGVVLESTN